MIEYKYSKLEIITMLRYIQSVNRGGQLIHQKWLVSDFNFVLVSNVYDNSDSFVYQCVLMPITDNEIYLKAGRFSRFVTFNKEDCSFVTLSRHNGNSSIEECFEEMITWISESTVGRWSVNLYHEHVSFVTMMFSFENHMDAVHFTLRWK